MLWYIKEMNDFSNCVLVLGFEAGFDKEQNLKRDISEEVQLHRTLLARSERKIPCHLNQGKAIKNEYSSESQWEKTQREKKKIPREEYQYSPDLSETRLGRQILQISQIWQKI